MAKKNAAPQQPSSIIANITTIIENMQNIKLEVKNLEHTLLLTIPLPYIHISFVRPSVYYENRLFKGTNFASKIDYEKISNQIPKYEGHNMPYKVYREWYISTREKYPIEEYVFDQLNRKMRHVGVDALDSLYLIVTAESKSMGILKHELLHSLYNASEVYRNRINKIWSGLDDSLRVTIEKCFFKKNYHQDVYVDEFHAYLLCQLIELGANNKTLSARQAEIKSFICSEGLWKWDSFCKL